MDTLLATHRQKKKKPPIFVSQPTYVGNIETQGDVDYVKICKTLSCFLFFSQNGSLFNVWVICDNLVTLFFLSLFEMELFLVRDPTTFCYLDMYDKSIASKKYFYHFNESKPKIISFFDYPHIRCEIDKTLR